MSRFERRVIRSGVTPIDTDLHRKGYTKDAVLVECAHCKRTVVCKWTRNGTPGINYGRPLIELPEDWKVILTYGTTKQDVLCDRCEAIELGEGVLLNGPNPAA